MCVHPISTGGSVSNLYCLLIEQSQFLETTKSEYSAKTTERIHSYNRQTKRLYGSIIYARGKGRFRLGTDTKQKGATTIKRPNEQWGIKSIYGRPTSHLLSIIVSIEQHYVQRYRQVAMFTSLQIRIEIREVTLKTPKTCTNEFDFKIGTSHDEEPAHWRS